MAKNFSRLRRGQWGGRRVYAGCAADLVRPPSSVLCLFFNKTDENRVPLECEIM
ncbi:hypothetical protein ANACOL_02245 [Anaerotruncus colihominis DSM 17241]|uniref:Uncharacterized protein n=1 Tax=Anaerotruncus colihominis DSM 17241 TaxID=445972 RepID=B0PBT7_9FIRM|nr:hypothetical protein ANACOL_02245 [Anaerotruncus colihominis DSM 17241]